MSPELCAKYLDFVANECERYLLDQEVTDEEMMDFLIELKRFKEKVARSDLHEEIKTKIAGIHLEYSIDKLKRNAWYSLLRMLTFGDWSAFYEMRVQAKRIRALSNIKSEVSAAALHIRWHY